MSEDDRLTSLNTSPVPPASAEARARALEAGLAAFDALEEKNADSVQGSGAQGRLRSILTRLRRNWTMDMRIPLGAGLAALVILPMSVALLNQTALTPLRFESASQNAVEAPVTEPPVAETADQAAPPPVADAETAQRGNEALLNAEPPMQPPMPTAAAPQMEMLTRSAAPSIMPSPLSDMAGGAGDQFTSFEDGGVLRVLDAPVSTFSVDVDTASYAYVRRMLEMGQLPQPDAVRVEELINYFSYDYAQPEGETPFATSVDIAPSPWNPDHQLVRIGIAGEAVDLSALPPVNLVFLIDTSGSMDSPDKLPLLKRAFAMLVDELGPEDTVSIVTYAGSAGVALEPTAASDRAAILDALERLVPGGSTAGVEGINAAYRLAEQAMVEGGVNRVLLATDGDFNVGISDPDALERLIARKRDEGISLSVLGFGTGNYNDSVMQALAQAGNGNAAYIDGLTEARRVLVEEMGGTLVTIAQDVKVQVEFNPAAVSEYRLIGYETRALNREDFNNDAVDAGDIGAGHTVTALYEITPVGAPGSSDPLRYQNEDVVPSGPADELAYLKLRYKAPGEAESTLIEVPILAEDAQASLAAAGADMQFATAVAAFGQKLRESDAVAGMDWDDIRALAVAGRGTDETGRRAEFIRLVDLAAALSE